MSRSFLLQRLSVFFSCLSGMGCKMEGKWPSSCCFVGCGLSEFFKTGRTILAYNSCISLESQVVQLYVCTDMVTGWKISCFIFSEIWFSYDQQLSMIVPTFHWLFLSPPSVDVILRPMHMSWSNNFRGFAFKIQMALSSFKHRYCIYLHFSRGHYIRLLVSGY